MQSLIVRYKQIQRDFFVAFCEWTSEDTAGMVCTAALQVNAGRSVTYNCFRYSFGVIPYFFLNTF